MSVENTERLYVIQGDEYHFFTGKLFNSHQVLMGIQQPELVIVEFDIDGKFLTLSAIHIGDDAEDSELEEAINNKSVEIGLVRDAIAVHKFFIDDRWIGIADLPDHYADYLENPEGYSSADSDSFSEQIRIWRENSNYVLFFSEDYYMSGEGELESS